MGWLRGSPQEVMLKGAWKQGQCRVWSRDTLLALDSQPLGRRTPPLMLVVPTSDMTLCPCCSLGTGSMGSRREWIKKVLGKRRQLSLLRACSLQGRVDNIINAILLMHGPFERETEVQGESASLRSVTQLMSPPPFLARLYYGNTHQPPQLENMCLLLGSTEPGCVEKRASPPGRTPYTGQDFQGL